MKSLHFSLSMISVAFNRLRLYLAFWAPVTVNYILFELLCEHEKHTFVFCHLIIDWLFMK